MQVFLQCLQVEALERFGVVETLVQGIRLGRVLMQDFEVELVRPPVPVSRATGGVFERALCFGRHAFSSFSSAGAIAPGFDQAQLAGMTQS
jgi:hypothetical protein